MPRMHHHLIRQRHEHLVQRSLHLSWIAGGKIHSPDRARKEGVPHDGGARGVAHKGKAPGAVTWRVQNAP